MASGSGNPFSPNAGGIYQPYFPYGDLFGGMLPGGIGMAANMVGAHFLGGLFGAGGGIPGFGNSSYYEHLQSMRVQRQFEAQQRAAAEGDMQSFDRQAMLLAKAAGLKMTPELGRAYLGMRGAIETMLPTMAAIAPEMLGAFMPDSRSVLLPSMFEATQRRINPATGVPYRAEETGAFVNAFGDRIQENGRAGMLYQSTGTIGAMFREMTARGMMPTIGESPDAIRAALGGSAAGMTDEGLRAYLDSDAGRTALRDVDVSRTTLAVQRLSKATVAVKELFGDPNAPMAEVLNALEALTGNGLEKFSPERLERMVRQTKELAKASGMTAAATIQMSQHFQQQAVSMGLDSSFGLVGAHAAMEYMAAAPAMGGNAAWGRGTVQEQAQMAGRLAVQAGGSEIANRLGLLQRLSQRGGGFGAGSQAGEIAAELAKGDDASAARVMQLMGRMTQSEFMQMVTRDSTGGLSMGEATAMLGQRFTNQEFAPAALVSRLQGEMTGRDMMRRSAMRALGQSPEARRAGARARGQLGDAMSEAMLDMTTAEMTDPELRKAKMRGVVQNTLGVGAAEADRIAENMFGAMENDVRGQFGSMQNFHAMFSRESVERREFQSAAAGVRGTIASKFAGFGTNSLGARLMGLLESKGPTDFEGVLKGVFGANSEQIAKQVIGIRDELEEKQNALIDEGNEIAKMDPKSEGYAERKREYKAKLAAFDKEVKKHQESLEDMAEKAGYSAEEEKLLEAASAAAEAVKAAVNVTLPDVITFMIGNLVLNTDGSAEITASGGDKDAAPGGES